MMKKNEVTTFYTYFELTPLKQAKIGGFSGGKEKRSFYITVTTTNIDQLDIELVRYF